jgi:plasmid replication initiation protein
MNKLQQIPEPLLESSEIAKLKAELQQAQEALQRQKKNLTIKIGEKGGVVVGGLGRFPITLYADQWEKLLTTENIENILKFITENKEKLAVKK